MTEKIIIFDLGGVLLDWNPRNLYKEVFQVEKEMEYFLSAICSPVWNAKMDAELSFEEGIAELLPDYPEYAEQIRMYHTHWIKMLGGEIPESVSILRELHEAGIHLAGLSNWPEDKFTLIKDSYPFLEWFDPLVISGMVGVAKPDPAIYQILLQEAGVSPENCLFVDDMSGNIEEAARQGFETIQFDTAQNLRVELENRGLLTGRIPLGKI